MNAHTGGKGTAETAHPNLASVVDALTKESQALVAARRRRGIRHEFPSRATLIEVTEALRAVLFPGYFGPSELSAESIRFHTGATLDT